MNYINLIKNFNELLASLRTMLNTKVNDNKYHLNLVGNWLIKAQSVNNDGGYSHSYSLCNGWVKSYPETTGYIIPSLLNLGEYLNDEGYTISAIKAGNWLCGIQQPDGSFLDLSGQRQIFDTGQIIEGLIELYKKTNDSKFINAAIKAGDFLVNNQDTDGKWTKFSYNKIPHTYYSRVAANLLKLYKKTGEFKYKISAEDNLLWTIGQQRENGYFNFMSFVPNIPPYLHTISYVLEGLLDSYKTLKSEDILVSLKKTVDKLVNINKERDFILYSQYYGDWSYVRKEKCMTGLAQWASLLLDLYVITNEEDYFKQAAKSIYYLKSKHILSGSKNITGAIPGSVPIWGKYSRFSFNNWTMKFFIDALLHFEYLDMPVQKEHEI